MLCFCPLVASVIILFIFPEEAVTLQVVKENDATIETFIENVKLHDIPFEKRHVNRSTPVVLKYTVSYERKPSKTVLTWLLDGAEIKVTRYRDTVPENPGTMFSVEFVEELTTHVTLHLRERSLIPGNYTLIVSSMGASNATGSASGYVMSPPVLPLFPKERRVLNGDRLSIFCEVFGYPKPTEVYWRFAHIKPDSMDDTGVLLDAKSFLTPLTSNSTEYKYAMSSVINDQLIFDDLSASFNGLFECSVNGSTGGDQTLILVNVKDRWAALWPFIGIVIEVTVLVTAILLYERHQLRSGPSKPDTAAGPVNDTSSPNAKLKAAAMQQNQQQHNTTVQVVNATDTGSTLDNNKHQGIESGDTKQEELRQRVAPKC